MMTSYDSSRLTPREKAPSSLLLWPKAENRPADRFAESAHVHRPSLQPDGRLYRQFFMEARTEIQRRRPAVNYRLNVIQIPMLRALGVAILCVYVLLYDLLIAPPFSLSGYLPFVAIFATYCLGSWVVLQKAYRKVRPFDLSLVFFVVDL